MNDPAAYNPYRLNNRPATCADGCHRYAFHFGSIWILISILTLIFAFATILDPVLSGLFLLGGILSVLAFLYLDSAILIALILFLLLYRVVFHYQTESKVFVEVIQVGSYMGIIAAYMAWVVRRMAGLENRSFKNYLNKPVGVLIFWSILSLFWTKDILHGIHLCVSLIINLMIIQLIVVLFSDKERVYFGFKFLIIASFFIGIIIFVSKWQLYEFDYPLTGPQLTFVAELGGDNFGPDPDLMRAAGFATANQVAFILNTFIFMVLSFLLQQKSFAKKCLYLLLFFFLLLCLALTGSKGGLLSFVSGICFILLINPVLTMKRIKWCALISLLLVLGVTIVLLLGEGRIVKSIEGGKSAEFATISFSSRIEVWKNGFKEFDNPIDFIFGYGIGSSAAKAEILPNMHSFYFSALLDLGIIGFGLFACIILMVVNNLYQAISLSRSLFFKSMLICLSGALIAAIINGLVMAEFSFHFFWIVIGIIVSLTNRAGFFEDYRQC